MSVDEKLLLISPEAANLAQTDREALATIAGESISSAVFGDQEELATAYLAAHMITIRNRAGNGGPVKSVKEGELSMTFGGDSSASGLDATSYGMEFKRIRSEVTLMARTRAV